MACTSEVEEFRTQTSVVPTQGIELGENFQIGVTNDGFSADPETRASMDRVEGVWTSAWDEDDAIGAARYNMILTKGEDDKTVTSCWGDFSTVGYMSNDGYNYVGENKFTSASNAMAGAYLLYYPFNEALNKYGKVEKIYIYEDSAAKSELEFDANDITKQVNEKIFAANIVEFNGGGVNAPEFRIKQIPNLYALSFEVEDKNLMSLDEPVAIKTIIIEAKKAGETVIYTNGTVEPEKTSPIASDYNEDENGDNELGGIHYQGTTKAELLKINVKNTNENYMLMEAGVRTAEKFYFSALPFGTADEIWFKVIADVNGVDKVYGKNVTEAAKLTALNSLMTGMGQVVMVNVVLDAEIENDVIYTLSQFNDKWANRDTTANKTFKFGVDLDVEQSLATAVGEKVTFEGGKITAENLKGSFVFNNKVEAAQVEGAFEFNDEVKMTQFTATGDSEFDAKATIEGNVVANAEVTFDGETIIGGDLTNTEAVTINAKATVAGKVVAGAALNTKQISVGGDLTANAPVFIDGDASMPNIIAEQPVTINGKATIAGDITANAAVEINGAESSVKNITATSEVTFAGEKAKADTIWANAGAEVSFTKKEAKITEVIADAAIVKLTNAEVSGNISAANAAQINGSNVNVKNVTLVESFSTIPTLTAEKISVDLESKVTVKSKLTADELDVTGNAEIKVNELDKLNINSTGFVAATGVKATSTINTVNVIAGNNKEGELNTTSITLGTLTNDGILTATETTINAGENNNTISGTFTVAGAFAQNGTAELTDITVTEDGALTIAANTYVNKLTNNGSVEVAKKVELTSKSTITNNNAITVYGTLTELAANRLYNKTAKSFIYVEKGGTLTQHVSSIATHKTGTVMIDNGCTLTNVTTTINKTIAYEWTGNYQKAPIKAVDDVINTIYVNGVTLSGGKSSVAGAANKTDVAILAAKNLVFTGDLALNNVALTMNDASTISVIEDVNITSADKRTFTIKGLDNKVADGKTLTLGDNVTIAGSKKDWNGDSADENSKLTIGAQGSFVGKKGTNIDIVY